MAFKDVYNALFDQLAEDTTLTEYVDDSQFLKGFRDNFPWQDYSIIVEPGDEEEIEGTQSYSDTKEFVYNIDIYARVIFIKQRLSGSIVGQGNDKGLLDFSDDIKAAIRTNDELGYNRQGTSVSATNTGTSFSLTGLAKYLTISINDKTPSSYDSIDCGETTLSGDEVATNIQTSLRALGNHSDDGYYDATCTFDNSLKKFTITSQLYGPLSKVTVTAGATDDCSSILGFDNPTELVGRRIMDITFQPVRAQNDLFPVRFRVIPVRIREERKIFF